MKKYVATLLVVMIFIGGSLSIVFGLAELFKFLIFDKGVEMWIVFLAFIFIVSIIITTINYFITKEDRGNEE